MIRRNNIEENKEYLRSIIGSKGKCIDWENSIGKKIEYEYNWNGELYKGVLKIVEYDVKSQKVYFEGYERGMQVYVLTRGALSGILNLIWYKARWMVDLGVSEEDAKTYTIGSNKKIEVKCPDCGKTKRIPPNKIYERHSIQCSCGDGIPYSEKLIENVLIQLGIKYERQYRANWSQNKVYDFYLIDYNIIIETHGEQHYEESNRGRTLKEEQENDKLKEELALKNGIEHYIVIDSRDSTLNWIKDNILDSELNELFDLNKVDWNKCEEYALKNKVKEVCDYYKPGMVTDDLAKEFGISRVTAIKYLNIGTKLNWCKYEPKKEMERGLKLGRASKRKSVLQFLDGELIKTYPSIAEAERQTGIDNRSISACCKGKYKTAGGYVWRYVK